MNSPDYNFVEEWDTNSPIDWWNEGRTKLNAIIKPYNQWQIDGFDIEQAKKLRAQIIYGIQTFATRDGGEAWLEELQKMLELVEQLSNRSL